MTFTAYSGTPSTLVDALLAASSGVHVTQGSIVLNASGPDAVSLYDGSLPALGVGPGLLLTSGLVPGTSNTMGWFGSDNSGASGFDNGDADIDAVVNTVFQTVSYDATTLSFSFTVTDPAATSISFDLVFGSDEYPEWVDLFVDCAIVMVNGVNYALFGHDPMAPLSVISPNLAKGYFQDNEGLGTTTLPIEYDGVSQALKIVAPIKPGQTNTIKIGIADTGDHILDSGLIVANLRAGNLPGAGVVAPGGGTDGDDCLTGSAKEELFELRGGDDTVYAGAGDDIVVAGDGNDLVYGGSGDDELQGGAGDDHLDGGDGVDTAVYAGSHDGYLVAAGAGGVTVTGEGTDALSGVELFAFADGLFSLDDSGALVSAPTGGGGTANQPGVVVVTGVAKVGNLLSASVVDADGIPGTITYQWWSSADGGATWTAIGGADASTYTVTELDAGHQLQARAGYIDGRNASESVASVAKVVGAAGKFDVNLMLLDAPAGASVMNPLTTLVADLIAMGVSPNLAVPMMRAALGLPTSFDPMHDDAWAMLQVDATDPVARLAAKIGCEVAILASLSDPTGLSLAAAILDAAGAGAGAALDLESEAGIAAVLGVVAGSGDATLMEALNRMASLASDYGDNKNMIVSIEIEWGDLVSNSDALEDVPFDALNLAVNLAPVGFAAAALAGGEAGADVVLHEADLLAGFTDPDGDALHVDALIVTAGTGDLVDNGNGTWTFTPAPGFTGPVELAYQVVDGQGGAASASQLFAVAPAAVVPGDQEASGVLNVGGLFEEGGFLTASLDGADDPDGGVIGTAYQWQRLSAGAWTDLAGESAPTLSIPDDQSLVLAQVRVVATTTDAKGGTTDFAGQPILIANVNDAPVVSPTPVPPQAATEDAPFGFVVPGTLITDPDGDTLAFSATLADGSALPAWLAFDPETHFFSGTPTNADVGAITVAVRATDAGGITVSANVDIMVANVNDAPTVAVALAAQAATTGTAFAWTVPAGTFADVDSGDVLKLSATLSDGESLPAWLSFNATTGTFGGTPSAVDAGLLSVRVTATDLAGAQAASTFSLTVAAPADLTLQGTAGNDVLDGASGNDTLYGLGGNDTLHGFGGNDVLVGGAGNDAVDGGDGSDLYLVDAAAHHAMAEFSDSGASGVDEVRFAAAKASTLTLFAGDTGIERVVLGTGAGVIAVTSGTVANKVDASKAANALTLVGNAGGNTLTGTAFGDALSGNAGNDSLAGGGGDDALWGGAGADTLAGGAGADLLSGGDGKDQLTGGAGSDRFVFDAAPNGKTNVDTLVDFASGQDRIQFAHAVFSGLAGAMPDGTGALLSDAFWSGSGVKAAHDASDRLIYDTKSGALYYDADGLGGVAAVQVAIVGTTLHPLLGASDFDVLG